MRVLFYNWADHADPERRGGGVSVYQRNVIDGLARRDGIETASLSSGLAHDLRPGAPRVVTVAGGASPRYALVNAGVLAPSHVHFANPAQLDHPATEAAFVTFIDRTGPWDVIHFNTLEGLPANILSLRDRWPGTRFVMSLHNYYPVCPQVNLWYGESRTCPGFDEGARCTRCLTVVPEPRSIRLAYAIGWSLSRIGAGPGSLFYDRAFRPAIGLAWRGFRRAVRMSRRHRDATPSAPDQPALPITGSARHFAERRARMIALINSHCDAVLCVSDRVRVLAGEFGLNPARTHTLRIGSREAEAWGRTAPRERFLAPDGTLRLAYLGYMRRDKGYHFLMRTLAALPPETAGRIHLTLAAKRGDTGAMALLAPASARLASLRWVDGYTHDDLDTLLADADLGVVPVEWEDNLPQVAIEMHARHIPLLCANRGGARELGRCDVLVHRAGDSDDFTRILNAVLAGRITPGDYWRRAVPPVSVDAHLDRLLDLYRGLA